MFWKRKQDPEEQARYWITRGSRLLRKRATRQALKHLERAMEVLPNDFELNVNLGTAYHLTGRHEKALTHFERVLAFDPDHATAALNLAAVYHTLNRHSEARQVLEELRRRHPRHHDVHYNLALAYLAEERLQEALVMLREELEINPESPYVLPLLERLLEERRVDPDQVRDILERGEDPT